MKKIAALFLVLCLLMACTGFAFAEDDDIYGGSYGCSVTNLTNVFYAACVSGVEQAIKDLDPEAQFVPTDASGDSGTQLDQVADLVQQGCKAIILIPIDSTSILAALDECAEAAVPVFIMDTPAEEHEAVIATVTADNYSAGHIAATALVEAIEGKGEIAVITTTGSAAVEARIQGLNDVLAEYPDVSIVATEICTNGTGEDALTIMENMIVAYPDLAGVFTTGGVFAVGICSALQSNGYAAGEIKVTSVDGSNDEVNLIKNGYLYASAAQAPSRMGYRCVENALAYLAGEEVLEYEELECIRVDATNYETFTGGY